ncbi:MAG: hypothetical protein EA376_02965 [Phycisphaeraceae bacterium]|nr:MAG: hypothetical protein EA376_02965 [Phycisphaeraceae bacterium]
MNLPELPGRLNRLQQSLRFKIAATIVLVALAITLFSAWFLYMHAPAASERAERETAAWVERGDAAAQAGERVAPRIDATALQEVLGSREATLSVALGVALVTGLACLVVWLGAGLTYMGLIAAGGAIAAPLLHFESTRSFGQLLAGVIILTASFTVLMQALRTALSGGTPIIAIARNVVNEAVRMKISLIFIVLLILLLAALPGLLDEAQPLRNRVRSFMQYGVSGAFWTLALMTLFFSAATIAFEQRDRIIWQTMSKPVRHAEYILGKWVGVMAINAVLLSVSASGVFLFTEYMRNQPAIGEERPFVNADGSANPTRDRLLLHSEVLVARVGVEPEPPEIRREDVEQSVERAIREGLERDAELADSPRQLDQLRRRIEQEQMEIWHRQARSVEPGQARRYVFTGLEQAKQRGSPLTLRYKVDAGSNDPTVIYRITFIISGVELVQETALGVVHTIPIRPGAISDDGVVVIDVINADIHTRQVNQFTITFPPGDLELLYARSGYEANFFRVMFVLWVKLGFVAAIAIAGATFLSFPVACLLAILALFAGETAGFLREALIEFPLLDNAGNIDLVSIPMNLIARPVAWLFSTYNELRPMQELVDGRLVSWSAMLKSIMVMLLWIFLSLLTGWAIFRKRELATYSGH